MLQSFTYITVADLCMCTSCIKYYHDSIHCGNNYASVLLWLWLHSALLCVHIIMVDKKLTFVTVILIVLHV